mmetsp:Transcript_35217/g.93297  ORF Transcript_35217/g.93297 Transcript_35217/m.93297 type:complete len:139 (+) Transcript_35217:180-596(+)
MSGGLRAGVRGIFSKCCCCRVARTRPWQPRQAKPSQALDANIVGALSETAVKQGSQQASAAVQSRGGPVSMDRTDSLRYSESEASDAELAGDEVGEEEKVPFRSPGAKPRGPRGLPARSPREPNGPPDLRSHCEPVSF